MGGAALVGDTFVVVTPHGVIRPPLAIFHPANGVRGRMGCVLEDNLSRGQRRGTPPRTRRGDGNLKRALQVHGADGIHQRPAGRGAERLVDTPAPRIKDSTAREVWTRQGPQCQHPAGRPAESKSSRFRAACGGAHTSMPAGVIIRRSFTLCPKGGTRRRSWQGISGGATGGLTEGHLGSGGASHGTPGQRRCWRTRASTSRYVRGDPATGHPIWDRNRRP